MRGAHNIDIDVQRGAMCDVSIAGAPELGKSPLAYRLPLRDSITHVIHDHVGALGFIWILVYQAEQPHERVDIRSVRYELPTTQVDGLNLDVVTGLPPEKTKPSTRVRFETLVGSRTKRQFDL